MRVLLFLVLVDGKEVGLSVRRLVLVLVGFSGSCVFNFCGLVRRS